MDSRKLPIAYAAHFFGNPKLKRLLREECLLSDDKLPESIGKTDLWHICIRNITQTNDESHGISHQPVGTWSTICGAVNQMETVGEGIVKFAELSRIAPIGMDVRVGRSRRGLHLTFSFSSHGRACLKREIYCEFIALVFHCSLIWMSNRTFSPSYIRLSEHLAAADGCSLSDLPCRYERHGLGTTLTYAHGDVASPLGQRHYRHWNAHEPFAFDAMLDSASVAVPLPDSPELVQLRSMLCKGATSQGHAAHVLGVSPATLRRRLKETGMTFRSMSRTVRSAQLEAFLQSNMSLDDIAAELGFSDRRSLWRACQQWFAMSPSAYRQRLHRTG